MATCDTETLQASACVSKFACLDPKTQQALILQLLCEISNGGGSGVVNFTSDNITLDNALTRYTVAHGLGATPRYVNCVFVCIADDVQTQYVIGDEINAEDIYSTAGFVGPTVQRDATHVSVALEQVLVGNEGGWAVLSKPGAVLSFPTSWNNFALKFYVQL